MTTKTDEARIVAQKLVNLELDRKSIVDEIKENKEKFEKLIEEGADTRYDLNNGSVFIFEETKYVVPDGLKEAVEARVKDASKLNPDLISKYFNQDLKLSRKATNMLRKSADPDLSQLVSQEEKSSVKIKVG